MRRQVLLTARIGRGDGLAVPQGCSSCSQVSMNRTPGSAQSQVDRADRVPQRAASMVPDLAAEAQVEGRSRPPLHELVSGGDRDVEAAQPRLVLLGVHELLDVGVVDPQHAHLGARRDRSSGAPARRRRSHDERDRTARLRHQLGDQRPTRAEGREVVPDAATRAHRVAAASVARRLDAVVTSTKRVTDGAGHVAVERRHVLARADRRLDASRRQVPHVQVQSRNMEVRRIVAEGPAIRFIASRKGSPGSRYFIA